MPFIARELMTMIKCNGEKVSLELFRYRELMKHLIAIISVATMVVVCWCGCVCGYLVATAPVVCRFVVVHLSGWGD